MTAFVSIRLYDFSTWIWRGCRDPLSGANHPSGEAEGVRFTERPVSGA